MRGTRRAGACGSDRPGIIPAYAGNTFFLTMLVEPMRDHPRVCGEHGSRAIRNLEPMGSSPRMRGTHGPYASDSRNMGIIPAYAGNTIGFFPTRTADGDHPRVCGEHEADAHLVDEPAGSSPRMRGTPQIAYRTEAMYAIIPAYAGNTDSLAGVGTVRWDHPRVCGEHPWAMPT